jgi:hypothetical protein
MIQEKIVKQGKRNMASRLLSAKDDKDRIAAWMQGLFRVLQVFNVRSVNPVNVRPLSSFIVD